MGLHDVVTVQEGHLTVRLNPHLVLFFVGVGEEVIGVLETVIFARTLLPRLS